MEIVDDEIKQIFSNRHVDWRFKDVSAMSARISSKGADMKVEGKR